MGMALGAALTAIGAPGIGASSPAFAMALPQNAPGTDILQPGTVTVQGTASDSNFPQVDVVLENYTITDTTIAKVSKDANAVWTYLTTRLRKLGVPTGDVFFSPANYNYSQNQNQTPTEMRQLSIVVAKQSQLGQVTSLVGLYSPDFVSNAYMNTQVEALNPAPLFKPLYQAALANARSQAVTLAALEDETVGPMLSVSTVPSQGFVQTVSGPYPTSPTVSGLQLTSYNYGQSLPQPEITAQLLVTFALVPKAK